MLRITGLREALELPFTQLVSPHEYVSVDNQLSTHEADEEIVAMISGATASSEEKGDSEEENQTDSETACVSLQQASNAIDALMNWQLMMIYSNCQ